MPAAATISKNRPGVIQRLAPCRSISGPTRAEVIPEKTKYMPVASETSLFDQPWSSLSGPR